MELILTAVISVLENFYIASIKLLMKIANSLKITFSSPKINIILKEQMHE
jgi:hypothetical protein